MIFFIAVKKIKNTTINRMGKYFWCNQTFNRVSYSNQNEKLEKHEPLWKNLKEKEY